MAITTRDTVTVASNDNTNWSTNGFGNIDEGVGNDDGNTIVAAKGETGEQQEYTLETSVATGDVNQITVTVTGRTVIITAGVSIDLKIGGAWIGAQSTSSFPVSPSGFATRTVTFTGTWDMATDLQSDVHLRFTAPTVENLGERLEIENVDIAYEYDDSGDGGSSVDSNKVTRGFWNGFWRGYS